MGQHPTVVRRHAPALVGAVWALLVVNTLGSAGQHFPARIAQSVTMGSLVLAFALAVLLNPRVRIRPSPYLFLLSLLLVVSLAASLRMESGAGALARCARLAAFLATLWLLTPWWHAGITFVRHHVRTLAAVLLSVLVGLLAFPGLALPDSYGDRLVGVLWYLTPPQVAQYAAVATGLAVLLWLGRNTTGASAALIALPAGGMLLLTHTRTALAALLAGLLVAGVSMTLTNRRARRVLVLSCTVAAGLLAAFGPAVLSWLRRGQSANALENLTGRQKVWDQLLASDRSTIEELIGLGLTDKSFNGHPIDSTWLAVYQEQGVVGVAVVAAVFGYLMVAAARRPPSAERACALFLIVYCLVASYPEVGIGDASPYMLHLALAAALLTRPSSAQFGLTRRERTA